MCVYLYTTVNWVRTCILLLAQTLLQGHYSFKKRLNECARHLASFKKGQITAHASSDTICRPAIYQWNTELKIHTLQPFFECCQKALQHHHSNLIRNRVLTDIERRNWKCGGLSEQIMISQSMLTHLRTAKHISDDLVVPKVGKSA